MSLSKVYLTNIVLALGFLALGLFLEIQVLLYIPLIVLLLSTLNDTIATWIAKSWMFLGEQMGKVSGFIILSFIFYVFLTPLAMLQGVFLRRSISGESNWKESAQNLSKESFLKPW